MGYISKPRRWALAFFILLLVGCSHTEKPLPKQPEAPTDGGVMTKVGNDLDKVDGRVAAAVTVAKEQADKPDVVRAEAGVALSYLPIPSEADVAFARQRAAKADAKDYAAAQDYGKKLLARIDSQWARMEADQREAKRVSDLKDARIVELGREIERVRKEASRNIFSLLGAGLIAAGALACAFASVRIGIPLMMAGAFAAAVPYILDSVWFPWLAGSAIVVFAGVGLFLFWERFHKKPIAEVKGEPADINPPTP